MIGPIVINWHGSENGVMSVGTSLWLGRGAAIGAALTVAAMWTQVVAAATISTEGWTVAADAGESQRTMD